MVRRIPIIVAVLLIQALLLPAQQQGCIASSPLVSFKLYVKPADYAAYPLREVNELLPGMKIQYQPVHIPGNDPKDARIALILAESAQATESQQLLVLEPQRANQVAEWEVPFRTEIVALVFGPQGLSESKVGNLVKKDAALVKELASYAEQNQRMEDLINLLAEAERTPRSGENLDAALAGFAARHGMPMTQLDRQASTSDQALALMRALNPTLSTYDPLAPDASMRLQQSAGLAASVAGLFWGSHVALYAGGAGLFLNMRSLLFPGSEFRSALLQGNDEQRLTLCARSEQHKSRTRVGYLWAARIPDTSAPAVTLARRVHAGAGLEAAVPLRLDAQAQWKHVSRAREWRLVAADGKKEYPINATPDSTAGTLRFRVPASAEPGLYQLAARWDWDLMRPNGYVQVHHLDSGDGAALSDRSRQRLVEGANNVEIAVEGSRFRFVEEARLVRKGDPYSTPRVVPHRLVAENQDADPQLYVLLNGGPLSRGMWQLTLKQTGGKELHVDVPVLPQPPVLSNLPIKVNRGARGVRLRLEGERTELISGLEAEGVIFTPVQPAEGASTGQASAPLEFQADVSTASEISGKQALRLRLKDRPEPVVLENAIEILGPLPELLSSEIAHREQNGVELHDGELSVGGLVTAVLRSRNAGTSASVRMGCRDGYMQNEAVTLRAGQTGPDVRLQLTGPDTFHLTFDPGRVGQHGCGLEARLENANGHSGALSLGTVVRLPKLESLTLTDELLGENLFAGTLTGQDLESIAAVGWEKEKPVPVNAIPRSRQGDSRNQELRIALPWPSPTPRAPILIWLRDETEGRLTKTRVSL